MAPGHILCERHSIGRGGEREEPFLHEVPLQSPHRVNGTELWPRLYPDGRIWYSRRISIVADCSMNMVYYPFDLQGCQLKIGSCSPFPKRRRRRRRRNVDPDAYRVRDLEYAWDTSLVAIAMPAKIQLPEFSVIDVKKRGFVEEWPSGLHPPISPNPFAVPSL